MAVTLVFMIPFRAQLSRPAVRELANKLGLSPTRGDDWDTQLGFRLIGDTGAVRFFRSDEGPADRRPTYEIHGTASSWNDRENVASLYGAALQVVRSMDVAIDAERVIDPNHSVELPSHTRPGA